MILVLTLLYIGILMLAVKANVIRPTLFWKLSPLLWSIFLLIALFIPIQFWAPSGPLLVGNYTVPIIPQVSGVVTEIVAQANQPLKKGDVLFEMDKTLYKADVDNTAAALSLARTRLAQARQLAERQAGSVFDVEQYESQVQQLEATLAKASYNLEQATVVAPSDGYATNIALRPGSRVVAFPVQPAMSFIETRELIVGALIAQNQLRYLQPGQQAEIAFKIYPGRVFAATVKQIVPARATGFEIPTGLPVIPQHIAAAPFGVQLILGPEAAALNLPSGATGRVAIYSDHGTFAQVIRKVELRMEAIVNYFNPY